MNLSQYVARKRLDLLDDLQKGLPPREGSYDERVLVEARTKGKPQMGSTRFEPNAIYVEFIYPDPQSSATILTVMLEAPQRIVFMPVPSWVVESIWQGEIDGSFHFESDARTMLGTFEALLGEDVNPSQFYARSPKGRA